MGSNSDLADLLTIILTTSASPIHPSTELLERVVHSLRRHADALCPCRLIIVADGNKVGSRLNYRAGRINTEAHKSYAKYKENLRALIAASTLPFERVELLELSTHHGFGFAVRAALEIVTTPLVCVVQHDRILLRDLDLGEIARFVLSSESRVGYVLLPTRATMDYPHRQRVRLGAHGIRPPLSCVEPFALPVADGKQLLPCLGWYDSTHISLRSHYVDFIFAAAPNAQRLITKGAFLENEIAPLQLAEIARDGMEEVVSKWRTYLYDDGVGSPLVGHLNGADAKSLDELVALYGDAAAGQRSIGSRWQREEVWRVPVD